MLFFIKCDTFFLKNRMYLFNKKMIYKILYFCFYKKKNIYILLKKYFPYIILYLK